MPVILDLFCQCKIYEYLNYSIDCTVLTVITETAFLFSLGMNLNYIFINSSLQFLMELMKVPRVESKLRVFSFKIQFRSQVNILLFSWIFTRKKMDLNLLTVWPWYFYVGFWPKKEPACCECCFRRGMIIPFYLNLFLQHSFSLSLIFSSLFLFSDQEFGQTKENYAYNTFFRKCFEPRNSQGYV